MLLNIHLLDLLEICSEGILFILFEVIHVRFVNFLAVFDIDIT